MPDAPARVLGSRPPLLQSGPPGRGVPPSWGHQPWPWEGCRCPWAHCSGNSWLLRQGWWPQAGIVCTRVFERVAFVCVCARVPVLVASTASEPTGALSHPS